MTRRDVQKRDFFALYDLRVPNIDSLRYHIATHDWSMCLQSADIQYVYNTFLCTVHMLIDKTIPVKNVTIGPRDPPFVTPLVKTLLNKRRHLRKSGRIDEANVLAEKINLLILETRSKQLAKLSEASPKQLWASVRRATKTNASEVSYPTYLFNDIESVNAYFADVCTDLGYKTVYSVEKSLRHMKHTSPGADNIPCWFYKNCSYEIAEVVTHILNLSFSSGTIPNQWRNAIVTLIPKVPKPVAISDYRPISVTPLLSRVAEKLLVANWLRPAIPGDIIADQFGFRPTGSSSFSDASCCSYAREL